MECLTGTKKIGTIKRVMFFRRFVAIKIAVFKYPAEAELVVASIPLLTYLRQAETLEVDGESYAAAFLEWRCKNYDEYIHNDWFI